MFKIIGATVVYGLALFGLYKALNRNHPKSDVILPQGGTSEPEDGDD